MKKTFLFCSVLLLASTQSSFAQLTGLLDLSFSSDGKALIDYGSHTSLEATAIQPIDQKIVSVGSNVSNTTFGGRLLVQRLLPDGSLDLSFNGTGYVIVEDFQESYAYACQILDDGKILVAGAAADPSYVFSMLVMRFNEDGSRDLTFGTNGIVLTDFTATDELAYDMTVALDGNIILAGSAGDENYRNMPALVRLKSDGDIDYSFGTNGIAYLTVTEIDNDFSSVIVNADGSIIASGHWDQGIVVSTGSQHFDVMVAKFTNAGMLDNAFGTNGITLSNVVYERAAEVFGMKMNTSGEIVVCGFTITELNAYDFALLKYDSDGVPVSTFGTNGIVRLNLSNGDIAYDLQLIEDKILVAGNMGNGLSDQDFMLAQFNTDGSLDQSFGVNGVVRTNIYNDFDVAIGMAMQADGKVVVCGKGSNGSYNDATVVRYDADMATGIALNQINSSSFSAFPNPIEAGQSLTLNLTDSHQGPIMLELLDLLGKRKATSVLSNYTSDKTNVRFNIPSELENGTYLLRSIFADESMETIKVVVSH